MCARHGRGAIKIYLSEKRGLAKKRLGNTALQSSWYSNKFYGVFQNVFAVSKVKL